MRIDRQSLTTDAMTEELNLVLHPLALARFEVQVIRAQHLECLAQVQ